MGTGRVQEEASRLSGDRTRDREKILALETEVKVLEDNRETLNLLVMEKTTVLAEADVAHQSYVTEADAKMASLESALDEKDSVITRHGSEMTLICAQVMNLQSRKEGHDKQGEQRLKQKAGSLRVALEAGDRRASEFATTKDNLNAQISSLRPDKEALESRLTGVTKALRPRTGEGFGTSS